MVKVDLEKITCELAKQANIKMRDDCARLIRKAYEEETNLRAKNALRIILENADCAYKRNISLCQDTGLPLVFVDVGKGISWRGTFMDKINRGIGRAYKEAGFRASTVMPFSDKTKFNPRIVHIEFNLKKGIVITVFPKGFGSENKSSLKMFNPTASYEDITDFVVSSVAAAGPDACPPFFVGIGIGGTSDYCLSLAKQALLSEMDKPGVVGSFNKWQEDILNRINNLNIGPMGLGGKHTALAVRIKMQSTHIAGLPVGVNISCHSLRSASRCIRAEKIEIL